MMMYYYLIDTACVYCKKADKTGTWKRTQEIYQVLLTQLTTKRNRLTMARIASIKDLNKAKDEDRNKGQEFYAGGAGRNGGSGVSVVGPNGDNNNNNIVDNIMKKASEGQGGSRGGGSSFKITFYKDAFQVNDGPVRMLNDPANQKFVDEVSKGYAPKELVGQDGKAPEIDIIDKRSENAPTNVQPKFKSFEGSGVSLGSSKKTAASGTVFTVQKGKEATVDATKPTTRIQIKLPNGKRAVGKFNKTHTVKELVDFVNLNVSGIQLYQLLAGRPPKPIENSDKTLDAMSLCNASLVVQSV